MKDKIKSVVEFFLIASLVMIAFMISTAKGQALTGGITAGVSTGSIKITEIPGSFTNVIEGNNIWGFNAGAFAKLSLSPFYVKPQLLLSYRHGMVDVDQVETAGTEQESFTMDKLEIPLLFGLHIIGPLSIEAGPVYNYVLHATDNFGGTDVTVKKSGLGFRGGAAADLGRLNLFVHYQGITNSSGSDDIATYKSPNELIFGIGIGLGQNSK